MANAKTDQTLDSQIHCVPFGDATEVYQNPCLPVFDRLIILIKNHIPKIHPRQAGSKLLVRRLFAGPEVIQVTH